MIYAAVAIVWVARQLSARRVGPAAAATLAAGVIGVVSANLLPSTAARLRYRSSEYILSAQVYHARGEDDRALDELRDGLAKAYRAPEQPVLPTGFVNVAHLYTVLGHRAGRDAESAAMLEQLALDYPQDADLHGILVAPHGVFDGLIGLAAHVHMAAALPQNYIAFEYPLGQPEWWYDIVEGLPNPIVKQGFIDVWDRPGLGVTFNLAAAKTRLADEDRRFFD
jgi:hypothetical protein